ncbi:nitroreductase family deazaflavin-dependent oxidoreductase [Chloroflexi bacterium CFX6]|nr:nitroreductase family deazaflavin-dependent oxidoreductase [Chloroflexi bacterium CFX6]
MGVLTPLRPAKRDTSPKSGWSSSDLGEAGWGSGGNMDVSKFTPKQLNTLRRVFHAMNPFMVFMLRIGLGRTMNIMPSVSGRIMVIEHRGRKSGKKYLTPVNYALVDGEVYCTAGFGSVSDWYKNIMANPQVVLRLPEGKRKARAEDVTDSPRRVFLMRQVIIGSGFAGPLFGVDQRKLNDEQLDAVTKEYRLVHFIMEPGKE